MGKRLKRGKQGNAAMYVTRNQAIKKLQLPLSQFRRLCILKGIHPREPKKKPQGSNKTYYHVKDINWLLHEPILQVLRDVKAHSKKVRKARAKQNERLAKRLMRLKPGYRLDHLVKERYPTFVDALRDLDDALTLVHLFAALPADSRRNVPRPVVETARRLATEWAAYVAKSGALRRVFVSVKGYYYQAEVMGQTVTWLQPHALQQVLPDDVDVRVLLTFEEFYATLLQFVLFRLYRGELGMAYPPVLDERLEKAAAGLAALMRDIADAQQATVAQRAAAEAGGGGGGVGGGGKAGGGDAPDVVQRIGTLAARIKQIEEEQEEGGKQEEGGSGSGSEEDEEDDEIDSGAEEEQEGKEEADGGSDDDDEAEEEEQDDKQQPEAAAADADAATTLTATAAAAGGALAVDPDDDAAVCASLLRGRVVFISRECPREPLLLVVRAFGGVAAWEGEGSPHPAGDPAITHAIVDRPLASVAGVAGGPGKGKFAATTQLVQPQWVFDSANFRVLMPERLYAPGQAPPPHLSPFVDPEEEGYTPEFYATVRKLQEAARRARLRAAGRAAAGEFAGEGGSDDDERAAADVDDALEDDAAAAQAYARDLQREVRKAQAAEEESEEEDEEEEEEEKPAKAAAGKRKAAAAADADADAEDAQKMKDIMMTTKTRKLYARMQRAVQGKRERAEALERRREQLSKKEQQKQAGEAAAVGAGGGRTKRQRK